MHQFPHYPGTGAEDEVGLGKGCGYTLNVPMPAYSEDSQYLAALREKLVPRMETFLPEFVLISAGFDAHKDDPLSAIMLTTDGYREMTKVIQKIAAEHSGGKVLSVLEGGYNLSALPECVKAHIEQLMA
jgi:acetoin utilization deacetylase AcuC-like enzyme